MKGFPRPAYGYGGEDDCKQLRVGELVTDDGAVLVWHRTYDGNQADVGTAYGSRNPGEYTRHDHHHGCSKPFERTCKSNRCGSLVK